MANEKVSQLVELTAGEIASEDVFMVGDMSAHESKKTTAAQLLLFVETSGSFAAATAVLANTASYILGSGVDGAVATASYVNTASYARRTGVADTAGSASYSTTASYVASSGVSADTASFLKYSGIPNGTASYALVAGTSNTANYASNLIGVAGGTSSYAMSGSFSISASWANTSSVANSASYALSARSASHALRADNALVADTVNSFPFPTFITPVTVYSGTAAVAWATFDCAALAPAVPASATVVILDCAVFGYDSTNKGYIYIRKNLGGSSYVLTTFCPSNADYSGNGGQGFFPMDTLTFQYTATESASEGITIRLIGYM